MSNDVNSTAEQVEAAIRECIWRAMNNARQGGYHAVTYWPEKAKYEQWHDVGVVRMTENEWNRPDHPATELLVFVADDDPWVDVGGDDYQMVEDRFDEEGGCLWQYTDSDESDDLMTFEEMCEEVLDRTLESMWESGEIQSYIDEVENKRKAYEEYMED